MLTRFFLKNVRKCTEIWIKLLSHRRCQLLLNLNKIAVTENWHCVKRVQIRSLFWSVFSCIWTEYKKIWTRKTSVFGHFSGSVKVHLEVTRDKKQLATLTSSICGFITRGLCRCKRISLAVTITHGVLLWYIFSVIRLQNE